MSIQFHTGSNWDIVPTQISWKDIIVNSARNKAASFALQGIEGIGRSAIDKAVKLTPKGAKALQEHYSTSPPFGYKVPTSKRGSQSRGSQKRGLKRHDSGTAEMASGSGSRVASRARGSAGRTARRTKRSGRYSRKRKYSRRYRSKRSYKRPKRGARKSTIINKVLKDGHNLVQEYGGKIEDGFNVTIGHSTHAWKAMMRVFVGSIVKLILNKVGYMHNNPEALLPNVSSGDVIGVKYMPSADDIPVAEGTISYTCGVSDSYETIVTGLCNAFALNWTSTLGGRNAQIQLISVFYYPEGANDGTRAQINLVGAMYSFYAESQLTLQNLTANQTSDAEITDVDALPVKGFSYGGNGSGAVSRLTNEVTAVRKTNLIANRDGLIQYTAGYPYDSLREPYTKGMFTNVKQMIPVVLPSGGLMVDRLVYEKTMSIDRFLLDMLALQYNGTVTSGATRTAKSNLGKFSFLSLEKFIETTVVPVEGPAPAITVPVKIGYEVNHNSGGMIKPKYTRYTAREGFLQTVIPIWNDATPYAP